MNTQRLRTTRQAGLRLRQLAAICLGLLLAAITPAAAQQRQVIDNLPGSHSAIPWALSADGSVLAGWLVIDGRNRAFRWTEQTGTVNLGILPGYDSSEAYGVSADGSVVVGDCMAVNESESGQVIRIRPFRWTAQTGMVDMGTLGGNSHSFAFAVSADGSTVVGGTGPGIELPEPMRAFRWTAQTGMVSLGTLPGHDNSYALGVSADGSVVVGVSRQLEIDADGNIVMEHTRAFRWTPQTGMVSLGTLPGYNLSVARAVSADGSVVVGWCEGPSIRAFRWTAQTGMVNIGTLPGASGSIANAVSADGSVVVGISDGAFRWTARTGMKALPGGASALAVSADGSVVVGNGWEGSVVRWIGDEETWTVSGRVVDAGEREPVEGAEVRVGDGRAMTEADGRFEVHVSRLEGGEVALVRAEGYEEAEVAVPVPLEGERSVDVGEILLGRAERVTVTGRVVDSGELVPLEGAEARLRERMATTGNGGGFRLEEVAVGENSRLRVEASGYSGTWVPVSAAKGEKTVDVGDVMLQRKDEHDDDDSLEKPVIEWVRTDPPDGKFLPGWGTELRVTARVAWNDYLPEAVSFFANGRIVRADSGHGPEYTAVIRIDDSFVPSLVVGTNNLEVIATGVSPDGRSTAQVESGRKPVTVLPVPLPLMPYVNVPGAKSGVGSYLTLEFSYPPEGARPYGVFDLPVLKRIGGEAAVTGRLDYDFRSGEWTLEIGGNFKGQGTKYSGMRFGLGDMDMEAGLYTKARGTATRQKGMDLTDVSLKGNLSLSGRYPLLSLNFASGGVLGPAETRALTAHPALGAAFRSTSVILYGEPSMSGTLLLNAWPQLGFDSLDFTGSLGLKARYDLGWVDREFVKAYAGGDLAAEFGLPGEFFRRLRARAFAGLTVNVWSLEGKYEYVFLDATYPQRGKAMAGMLRAVPVAGSGAAGGWRPMERPWRGADGGVFVAGGDGVREEAEEALAAFGRLGWRERDGDDGLKQRRIRGDGGLPVEAEVPLVENVFGCADPALAAKGGELMLLFVRDTGAEHPAQFTGVAWMRYDGESWSAPAALHADARGQFGPQVAFDGSGSAVAVFERIRDAEYAGIDPEELGAQMEVVWSRWDPETGAWSEPQPLTDNGVLDFSPQLAGPLANGDLLLTWRRNAANQRTGSGGPAAATRTQVLSARWSAEQRQWSAPLTVVDGLVGERSESLAAAAQKGVYLWSADADGDGSSSGDAELYYALYDAGTGAWSGPVRYTNDGADDHSARAVMDEAGGVRVVWVRDGALVTDRNFAGVPSVVREAGDRPAPVDFALTGGPDGHVAVIWQGSTESGPDAFCRIYDPASQTWGLDMRLSEDGDAEQSFAPAWDAAGNLTLAYCNTKTEYGPRTVALDDGTPVTVENVPQEGRTDLLVAKRRLVRDLLVPADGVSAEGTSFLPGDEVTLRAQVRNAGSLAVKDVAVGFYDGDPAAGGTLIGTATAPGWLRAADTAEVKLTWKVPQPAVARTVHVVADPAGEVAEADETNNRQALPLNGVDLAVSWQSGSVLRDGSARVVARVRNLSAPGSPATTLRLQTEDRATTLAEEAVVALAPGESVDVALALPAGSHPEGERAYRLVVDEAGLTGDIDRANNDALFTLNLWIDADGDGLPRVWEMAAGLSDADPADADTDLDGDGFTNRQEYLAGTDPRDAGDFLRIGEVAWQGAESGGGVAVRWTPAPGRYYTVERSTDLVNWMAVERNVPAQPPLNTVVDPDPPPGTTAFYRLRLLQSLELE